MRKGELRRIVSFLLAIVFLTSTGIGIKQIWDKHQAQKTYELALAAAMSSEGDAVPMEQQPAPVPTLPELPAFTLPEDGEFLLSLDLNTLRQTNEDVLGWIFLPQSRISYPLMRSHDNEDYLHKTWDGTPNSAGSIFLEQHSSPDFTDFHSLIYGHNMGDGSMFNELHKFAWQDIADGYPYVYIALDGLVLCYEVFSAYEASIYSDAYRLSFADDSAKEAAIAEYKTLSEVSLALTPTAQDHLLTLSTCAGLGETEVRWVVHTVLCGIVER